MCHLICCHNSHKFHHILNPHIVIHILSSKKHSLSPEKKSKKNKSNCEYLLHVYTGTSTTLNSWIPSRARLTVWQQEHWTLVAPRMYISKVWQAPQTNWAISVPDHTKLLVNYEAKTRYEHKHIDMICYIYT